MTFHIDLLLLELYISFCTHFLSASRSFLFTLSRHIRNFAAQAYMASLFSHEVHSQLQIYAPPWRRAFNYYIKYINIGKTKLLIRIYIHIQYMNLRDERHKLTQILYICTRYLDGRVVPQNCTSITKAFLTIF